MKTFNVSLTRIFIVSIKAKNAEEAKLFAEYYIGNGHDLSKEADRLEKKFSIEDIEPVWNEASEIIE